MRYVSLCAISAVIAPVACDKSTAPVGQPDSSQLSALTTGSSIDIHGAGATFPYPLYSKWIADFQKVDPRVRINYQSIGSGGGIRQILERTVDFGATDAPMTADELAKAPAKLLHIPMTMGAVVVTHNLPGLTELRLTPDLVASIFLGDIKVWNDPRLKAVNPDASLPGQPIGVVYRSDGSGTTAIFTEYLMVVSAKWKEMVGAGKSVKFPVGLGAKGNEGVAGQVKTSPGTIGYVELAYAEQTKLSIAAIKNRAGHFVEPTLASITAAAAGVASNIPDSLCLSLVDAAGPHAYPIAAFTYILVYEEQSDRAKGDALARFLWWAVHEGQAAGPALSYASLPLEVVAKVEPKLRRISSHGQPLLAGK